jgi:uncharacterized protein
MPSPADVETIERFYAAFATGDLDAISRFFRADAVWYLPGSSEFAGAHHGWAAIRDEVMLKQAPLSGGTFRARLLDIAVGERYIVAIVHATAQRGDQRLDQSLSRLLSLIDGKIAEIRDHDSNVAQLDAFWGTQRET